MSKVVTTSLFFLIFLFTANPAGAVDLKGFNELTQIMDSAKVVEADVFAPKNWEKASKAFSDANKAINANKNQKTINKHIKKSREYVEHAIRATEVAKLSLQDYLLPRDKAKEAKASSLAAELYLKAETQFKKAAAKVESGDVKGGLKEAKKSSPMFDIAEMEAIRAYILGGADRLIEKASSDDGDKYAYSTLNKARNARDKANHILTKDRYNRGESVQEAKLAEYEARHASNIAMSVRSLERNDQAWEKLMLLYEIQMNRVGKAFEIENLPFDNGPLAAADMLIDKINNIKSESELLSNQSEDLSANVKTRLREILLKMGDENKVGTPLKQIEALETGVTALLEENNKLTEEVSAIKMKQTELLKKYDKTTSELSIRMEREDKFKQAKKVLNPSEGEVLFNSSNDIVLRLSGLSFDIGKSEIKDEHIPLVEKVKEVLQMFPNSQIVIEGHTDAFGDRSANVLLSEKRAFAVMQYLRQSLLIPANRIHSMGYGDDKPVASNQTKDGRAKNRRIDVIIMQ